MDYVALKAEYDNDPSSQAYYRNTSANTVGQSQSRTNARALIIKDVVSKLNASLLNIPRRSVSVQDLHTAAGSITSLVGDSISQYNILLTLAMAGNLDLNLSQNTSIVDQIFPVAQRAAQNTAVKALASRQGSRAELLFGRDVTELDVAIALWGDDR